MGRWIRHILTGWLAFTAYHITYAQEANLAARGYDMHVELTFDEFPSADRYEIFRKGPGETDFSLLLSTRQFRLQDWTGREDITPDTFYYFLRALNVPGVVLHISDTVSAIVFPMSDDELLDMVQEYTFRYFWDYAHPVSGLARERLGSNDIVAIGGSGFGVMSILVGVHRGYITREEGVDRLLKIVSFLQFADKFHGVFPHWMNGSTGDVIPFSTFDNGGDLVETAFLMEGLLTARAFFDRDNPKEDAVRSVITSLWEDVEWDFFSRNDSGVLYWHWSPQHQWQMNFPIRGYNEALIVYLLAIASPTHSVPASYYHDGWAGGNYENGLTWYGYKLPVGPPLGGPLFFAHYSFMGFDPRHKKDAYANYFIQNKNHTLINRAWCIANPLLFEGYGQNSWGLTASDDPFGYSAHAPGGTTDNGTLTPAAAIPSMPYTPEESMDVLKHFYREYGAELWGPYGFYDAFNPEENWFADSYIAIDQGPIINMIENYRSQLLWNSFMSNPEIAPALAAIGFEEDFTAVTDAGYSIQWNVSPTISDGEFMITLPEGIRNYHIEVVSLEGKKVASTSSVSGSIHLPAHQGWAYIHLTVEGRWQGVRPVFIR